MTLVSNRARAGCGRLARSLQALRRKATAAADAYARLLSLLRTAVSVPAPAFRFTRTHHMHGSALKLYTLVSYGPCGTQSFHKRMPSACSARFQQQAGDQGRGRRASTRRAREPRPGSCQRAGPSPWPRLVASLMSGPRRARRSSSPSRVQPFLTVMSHVFMQRATYCCLKP